MEITQIVQVGLIISFRNKENSARIEICFFFHLICLFLSKTYYMQVDSHKESISLYLINKSERWYNYSGITKTTRVDLELDEEKKISNIDFSNLERKSM